MSPPLEGKSVLVTRPRHQVADLAAPLEALGATVFAMPAIEIVPPSDTGPLDQALQNLESYDWVVLTSVNGVDAVARRMDEIGLDRDRLSQRRIAVIGPSTGRALAAAFREPDVVPQEFVAEAIAEALGDVSGQRFLLARADLARRDLSLILTEAGAEVTDVVAYRIVRAATGADLPDGAPDFITLTSSEAVRATRDALIAQGREHWMSASRLICIGPITANTVRELGYVPAAVAEPYTVPGLVDALVAHVRDRETTHA